MEQADRIRARRDRLADGAPALAECARGTVVARRTRCGKQTCACARDPERRHGPYHYLLTTVRGQTRTVFIPSHLVAQVRRWSANYARVRRILEQVTEANSRLLAAQRERRGREGR